MSWESQMIEMTRVLINDYGSSPTYSDASLARLLIVSAFQVNQEGLFSDTYTVDILSQTITPDPVDANDIDFINLWLLKNVCNIYGGEWKQYSLSSISVRNGPSSIDMSEAGKNLKDLNKAACDKYDEYKMNVIAGKAGKAIITPFSLGSDAVQPEYNRGQYFNYNW